MSTHASRVAARVFPDATPRLFGMIHLRPLPATPRAGLPVAAIIAKAVEEASVLAECGFDGAILENMHDRPYLNRSAGPEIVAAMSVAAHAVREATPPAMTVGVQVLAGCNREALAIAHAAGLDFIRAEGFVFAHVADEGPIAADAGELLRYRRAIGAQSVAILADIKKKHAAHAITGDVPLADMAEAAEFFLADGLVITGTATARPTDPADLAALRGRTSLPLLVGSGLTIENIASYVGMAQGFIVGSALKRDGHWAHDLDIDRCQRFALAFRRAIGPAARRTPVP